MTTLSHIYPDNQITLREVGLRDGLQMVKTFPSTNAKRRWIEQEVAAGVRHFEIGSFLSPQKFPQFADITKMIEAVAEHESAFSAALAMNERGAQSALQSRVDEIVCVVSATEEHSQANMRCSRADAVKLVHSIRQQRDAAGHKAVINTVISMAFGCSIAGTVDPAEVLKLAEAILDAGSDVVGIADTVGFAGPKQVAELTTRVCALSPSNPVSIHLHDTRGLGLANASAALDSGAAILDASLGGLGGCPFAPGATGNIVFEDLVFLCETKGFSTGIDLDALAAARATAEASMPGEKFFGALARAGAPSTITWKA